MTQKQRDAAPAGDMFRGSVAESYASHRSRHPIWEKEFGAVEQLLDKVEATNVLDMPFGTGRFAPLYAARGLKVSGLDVSQDMLDTARAELGTLYDKCDLRLGDATELPYVDSEFDLTVCIRFLTDIVPFEVALRSLSEIHRVTRKHAILMLKTTAEGHEKQSFPEMDKRLGIAPTARDLEWLLIGCGFKIREQVKFNNQKIQHREKRFLLVDRI